MDAGLFGFVDNDVGRPVNYPLRMNFQVQDLTEFRFEYITSAVKIYKLKKVKVIRNNPKKQTNILTGDFCYLDFREISCSHRPQIIWMYVCAGFLCTFFLRFCSEFKNFLKGSLS